MWPRRNDQTDNKFCLLGQIADYYKYTEVFLCLASLKLDQKQHSGETIKHKQPANK